MVERGDVVVDASSVVDFLLRPHASATFASLLKNPAVSLHAPALCDVETAETLRRAALRGLFEEPADLTVRVARLVDLPVVRYPHHPFLQRVLELRDNFTAYDASYVALAEVLDATLVTADGRLAEAARSHTRLDVHPTIT